VTIRRTAFALLVLLGILGAWLSYQQTVAASDYREDPRNPRTLQERFLCPRGSIITADGVVVAETRPAGGRYLRVYPEAGRYAHTVGYSSLVFGETGLEATRGADLTSEDDGSLRALIIEALGGSLAPHDVRLTLRDDLQQTAFAALGDQVGAVVALDPATGAVLALAASPTFDPNTLLGPGALEVGETLEADPERPLLDRTRSEFYAPGSTFKLIVTSAGLSTGFVAPETRLPDTDVLELPGSTGTIVNADGGFCGNGDTVTLERALIVSCNTAFAELGMQLGSDPLLEASEEAGFNGSVPFELPVVESVFPTSLGDDLPAIAQSAIGGRDVRASPLHMALVAAGIANGGVVMTPYLVDAVLDEDGVAAERTEPAEWRRMMASEDAATLAGMMVRVVAEGTGRQAQVPGVAVAGKTGTAEVPDAAPDVWFVGFAPADDPGIAVAVLVEAGGALGEDGSGGSVAAPIARTVIEAWVRSQN
jgi:peptidoglycan glycosyltransferase